jgi:hypothetical protein
LPREEWLELGDAHRRIRVALMRSTREVGLLRGLTSRQVTDMEHGRADPTQLLDPLWAAMLHNDSLDIPPRPSSSNSPPPPPAPSRPLKKGT